MHSKLIVRSAVVLLFFVFFLHGFSGQVENQEKYSSSDTVLNSSVDADSSDSLAGGKSLSDKLKGLGKGLSGIVAFVKKTIPGSGIIAWVKVRIGKIIFLCISLVVIFYTINFYRQKTEKTRFLTTTRLSIMDKEVQRACRNIETNFADPEYSVKRLCEELVTGEAFLEALFQKELGMSVGEFIGQVRINHARILLNKTPSLTPEELAFRCGFPDAEAFSRSFRSIAGIGFSEYINSPGLSQAEQDQR